MTRDWGPGRFWMKLKFSLLDLARRCRGKAKVSLMKSNGANVLLVVGEDCLVFPAARSHKPCMQMVELWFSGMTCMGIGGTVWLCQVLAARWWEASLGLYISHPCSMYTCWDNHDNIWSPCSVEIPTLDLLILSTAEEVWVTKSHNNHTHYQLMCYVSVDLCRKLAKVYSLTD